MRFENILIDCDAHTFPSVIKQYKICFLKIKYNSIYSKPLFDFLQLVIYHLHDF